MQAHPAPGRTRRRCKKVQTNQLPHGHAPQNGPMPPERRASVREPLTLHFMLEDGSPAVTRDISAHGLYFTVPDGTVLARWLAIEYSLPETGLRFVATAEVVRTDPAPPGPMGVAVRWHAPQLLPLD